MSVNEDSSNYLREVVFRELGGIYFFSHYVFLKKEITNIIISRPGNIETRPGRRIKWPWFID